MVHGLLGRAVLQSEFQHFASHEFAKGMIEKLAAKGVALQKSDAKKDQDLGCRAITAAQSGNKRPLVKATLSIVYRRPGRLSLV